MQLPLSWLRQFCPVDLSAEEIAEKLTMAGLEVDRIEDDPLGFTGVVIGEVLEASAHPEAEKLRIARVSDGTDEFQVVCGAANCRKGIKVAFARVGARLGDLKIKKAKLRGVESYGMLCAAQELGVGDSGDGIMELEGEVGTSVESLYGETIIEISLTPNLAHCWSVLGVARELSALTGVPVEQPEIAVKESGSKIDLQVSGEVPRYGARIVRGVKVGPSPDWLARRLEQCGIRSVNNVVDVTNLVMMELGQPMHAFDLRKIEGNRIEVRRSKKGEKLETLDGEERTLDEGLLLICDGKKPVAVAGVMGGANSEVGDETVDILLEAAHFDPADVRASSKALGLSTESSRRFERGVDPNLVPLALDRAAMLLEGEVAKGIVDTGKDVEPRVVKGRLAKLNGLLGTEFTLGEVQTMLGRLEMKVKGGETFSVEVPSYRFDVKAEIDLIEEVARIYGYNTIPAPKPRYRLGSVPHAPLFLFEQELRRRLVSEGLQEFVTNSLLTPEESLELPGVEPVEVVHSVMRTSLLPSLVKVVHHNQNHGAQGVAGFEIGRVHSRIDDDFVEEPVIGIVMAGSTPVHWEGKPRSFDFYDLKGVVERLLEGLKIPAIRFEVCEMDPFHPGRQAAIFSGDVELGVLGELRNERTLFATLSSHELMRGRPQRQHAEPLPQFPGSARDWTLTVCESVTNAEISTLIASVPSRLLKKVAPVAIYRSADVGEGWKSVTYRFTYRDDRKTISAKAVEAEQARIQKSVVQALSAKIKT